MKILDVFVVLCLPTAFTHKHMSTHTHVDTHLRDASHTHTHTHVLAGMFAQRVFARQTSRSFSTAPSAADTIEAKLMDFAGTKESGLLE